MQKEIKFVIPGNPVGKKNSMNVGRNRFTGDIYVTQNKKYKKYAEDAAWHLKTPDKPIDTPVNVKMVFYRDSRRVVDLSNLINAILDIMVDCEILKDDNRNIVYSMDGSRVYYDKENPRCEITITPAEDATIW